MRNAWAANAPDVTGMARAGSEGGAVRPGRASRAGIGSSAGFGPVVIGRGRGAFRSDR